MRESRSSGSVGERGGNEPLYPDNGEWKIENGRGIGTWNLRHGTWNLRLET